MNTPPRRAVAAFLAAFFSMLAGSARAESIVEFYRRAGRFSSQDATSCRSIVVSHELPMLLINGRGYYGDAVGQGEKFVGDDGNIVRGTIPSDHVLYPWVLKNEECHAYVATGDRGIQTGTIIPENTSYCFSGGLEGAGPRYERILLFRLHNGQTPGLVIACPKLVPESDISRLESALGGAFLFRTPSR